MDNKVEKAEIKADKSEAVAKQDRADSDKAVAEDAKETAIVSQKEADKAKAKKPVELGSPNYFMLEQAVSYLNGGPVKRSASKLE